MYNLVGENMEQIVVRGILYDGTEKCAMQIINSIKNKSYCIGRDKYNIYFKLNGQLVPKNFYVIEGCNNNIIIIDKMKVII